MLTYGKLNSLTKTGTIDMSLIGTGKIGKVFINICRGFGMKVLAYDKFPAGKGVIFDGFPRTIPQAEALKKMKRQAAVRLRSLPARIPPGICT